MEPNNIVKLPHYNEMVEELANLNGNEQQLGTCEHSQSGQTPGQSVGREVGEVGQLVCMIQVTSGMYSK